MRELEFLRASIAHAPASSQNWLWRIRAKILTYLLARYGRETSREPVAPPAAPMPAAALLDVEIGPRQHVEPRPGEAFRDKLSEIRSSNDGFRSSYPEEPEAGGSAWRWIWRCGVLLLVSLIVCGGLLLLLAVFIVALERDAAAYANAVSLIWVMFIMTVTTWLLVPRGRR